MTSHFNLSFNISQFTMENENWKMKIASPKGVA